ncbi:MAG: HmuY family protein [Bacteroidales bacterium]|nr:HmuY family protein [Bacteroidales bacterium]
MCKFYHYNWGFWGLIAVLLSSCHGIFGGIFDDPDTLGPDADNTIYVDASDWWNWYYIDFSNPDAPKNPYRIPDTLTSDWDGASRMVVNLYDVFGEGLSVHEEVGSATINKQAEPDAWDIAIHRDNVRTNGGSVLETKYNSIDDLPADISDLLMQDFTADVADTYSVWVKQDSMMNGYVGCQAIEINRVLSGWLRFDIPPIPPSFTYNGHVFIVRFSDGRIVALRLANYQDAYGTKCKMTIEYKFL